MKSHRMTTYVILLVFMQVNKRREISSCGQLQTTLAPSITNSYETHRWPWHVAIYHRRYESVFMYECGGTLIRSDIVLTAAHCVMIAPQQISVSLGRFTLDRNESSAPLIEVAEVIKHPNYDPEYLENDIAIISLSTSATFNSYVQPICLWKASKTNLSEVVGKSGTVVGWGLTETGELSNKLLQASLPVIDPYKCLKSNRDIFARYISDKNYCAGSRNGTSVCTGDSGGSMTFEENGVYHIRGIVSVSASKVIHESQKLVCDPMQYAVFTDVARYLKWINDILHLTWVNGTTTTIACSTNVRCDWSVASTCLLVLPVDHYSQRCKIIFDEVSNPFVGSLSINEGPFDGIPDLSDAVEKFENLETVQLENLKIRIVERGRLTTLTKIKTLSLSYNEIAQLNGETFNDLRNLTDLSLDSNKLGNLSTDLFKELSHLETLRLDDNKLEILPPSILQFNKNMRRLSLSKSQLTELDVNIFRELKNLEKLFLHENKFKALPAAIFKNNKSIRDLGLFGNLLIELDANIFKELGNLEKLFLHENKFETLPATIFHGNRNMQELTLSKNQLTDLDGNIFKRLINLQTLYLGENKFETLPAVVFKDLVNLVSLVLDQSKFQTLPAAIFSSNIRMQLLSLSRNQLTELDENIFKELENIETLLLYENKFGALPAVIFKGLPNLVALSLHTNKFQTLPAAIFSNNKQMQQLDLSRNQLIELDANIFKELRNLEFLFLNENKLEVLPAGLFNDNVNLKEINLENNKLWKIEANFNQLTQHTEVNFRGNVCIDDECGVTKGCDNSTLHNLLENVKTNC